MNITPERLLRREFEAWCEKRNISTQKRRDGTTYHAATARAAFSVWIEAFDAGFRAAHPRITE